MALVKRQSNSTRLIIIMSVVVVVAGIGFFLARQYLSGPAGNQSNGSGPASKRVITNFGESILNDSRYTDLKTYGLNLNVDANTQAGQPEPFQ